MNSGPFRSNVWNPDSGFQFRGVVREASVLQLRLLYCIYRKKGTGNMTSFINNIIKKLRLYLGLCHKEGGGCNIRSGMSHNISVVRVFAESVKIPSFFNDATKVLAKA